MSNRQRGDIDATRSAIRPRLGALGISTPGGSTPPLLPHKHAASEISFQPNDPPGYLSADDVQEMGEELDSEKLARSGVQPMLGALDMNHFDINNILNAEVEVDASVGQDLTVGRDATVGRNIEMTGPTGEAIINGPRRVHMVGDFGDGDSLIDHLEQLLFVGTPAGGFINQPSQVDWNILFQEDSDRPAREGSMHWGGSTDSPVTSGKGTLVVHPASGALPGSAAFATVFFPGNPSDGDAITIGGVTYTFRTVLTPVDGEVLIGGDMDTSIFNLVGAVTFTGTPGVDYAGSTPNPDVTASLDFSGQLDLDALVSGTAGNSIVLTGYMGLTIVPFSGGTEGGVDITSVALGWDVEYCVAVQSLVQGQVVMFDPGESDVFEMTNGHYNVKKYVPSSPEQPYLIESGWGVGIAMTAAEPGDPVQVMYRGIMPPDWFSSLGLDFTVGLILWVDPATALVTNVRPTAPGSLIRVGAWGGFINVQVVPPISELSGVLVEDPEERDVFIYDLANQRWEGRRLFPTTFDSTAGPVSVTQKTYRLVLDGVVNATVLLPPTSVSHGLLLEIAHRKPSPGLFTVTITPDGSDTIEGEDDFVLRRSGESVTLLATSASGSWGVL